MWQLGNGLNILQELELVVSSELGYSLLFSSWNELAYQLHAYCHIGFINELSAAIDSNVI